MAEISLSPEDILNRIKDRGGELKCNSCNGDKIGVSPGFGNLLLQDKLDGSIAMNTPHIPVIYLICDNCGAMTPHALGALNLVQF